jgi:hypothetical protein
MQHKIERDSGPDDLSKVCLWQKPFRKLSLEFSFVLYPTSSVQQEQQNCSEAFAV